MKSWEEIESIDDLVIESDKILIRVIESELTIRCPHLRRIGRYFYYCAGGILEDVKLRLEPFNPIIIAKQEIAQLQLHCMDRYKACCHYKGTLPFPGSLR